MPWREEVKKKKEHSNQETGGGYVRQIGLRIETGSKIVSWQFSSVSKFSNNAGLLFKINLVIQPQETQDLAATLFFLFTNFNTANHQQFRCLY